MIALYLTKHLPVAVFVFALGSIVGSFINVVVYRLPQGMSVIIPPSRCPVCGARLRWWENMPILGWFIVRGRCRHCRARVSPQYMVVELVMALLFVGLYAALYMAGEHGTWWGDVGGPWFHTLWVWRTSPVFCAYLVLLAGLVAMTLIDARTFTIPIEIPLVVTVVAFVFHPLQGVILQLLPPSRTVAGLWPIPLTDWQWFATALGGMVGIGIGLLLLRLRILRCSFEDYDEYVKEGEALAEYPHARREMVWEVAFLVPCVAGLVGGWLAGQALPAAAPPLAVQALGATFAGYLVGGGLIWGIRILGTLLFGKEAMGAGDVHLLAAVGAVLGCVAPMWVFFLAPFSGLLWVAVSKGLVTVFTKARRELPYGPHLAVATVAVMGCEPALEWIQANYLPWLPG